MLNPGFRNFLVHGRQPWIEILLEGIKSLPFTFERPKITLFLTQPHLKISVVPLNGAIYSAETSSL